MISIDNLISTLAGFSREKIRQRNIAAALGREDSEPERYVWMSFCDPDAHSEQQFLGATVVLARGPATATSRTHGVGINPGGEIMMQEFSEDDVRPDKFPREQLDFMFEKLRSKQDMIDFGIEF